MTLQAALTFNRNKRIIRNKRNKVNENRPGKWTEGQNGLERVSPRKIPLSDWLDRESQNSLLDSGPKTFIMIFVETESQSCI